MQNEKTVSLETRRGSSASISIISTSKTCEKAVTEDVSVKKSNKKIKPTTSAIKVKGTKITDLLPDSKVPATTKQDNIKSLPAPKKNVTPKTKVKKVPGVSKKKAISKTFESKDEEKTVAKIEGFESKDEMFLAAAKTVIEPKVVEKVPVVKKKGSAKKIETKNEEKAPVGTKKALKSKLEEKVAKKPLKRTSISKQTTEETVSKKSKLESKEGKDKELKGPKDKENTGNKSSKKNAETKDQKGESTTVSQSKSKVGNQVFKTKIKQASSKVNIESKLKKKKIRVEKSRRTRLSGSNTRSSNVQL